MTTKDYYSIMGVSPSASQDDIKRKYFQYVKKLHPDANTNSSEEDRKRNEEKLKEINEAYDIIGDPKKRAQYDNMRKGGQFFGGTGDFGNFHNFKFESSDNTYSAFFDNFFDAFIGRNARQAQKQVRTPKKGEDIKTALILKLEEVFTDKNIEIELTKFVECGSCNEGMKENSSNVKCPQCHGSGVTRTTNGIWNITDKCNFCGGTGLNTKAFCERCSGSGRILGKEKIKTVIPKGADSHIVVGGGNKGVYGGARGNLIFEISIQRTRFISYDDKDIVCSAFISVYDAILGLDFYLTIGPEKVKVSIPAGVQNGQEVVVKGYGLPSNKGIFSKRGNLRVLIHVEVPTQVDDRETIEKLRLNSSYGRFPKKDDFMKNI